MKDQLQDLLKKCIQDLINEGLINEMPPKVRLDHTKDKSHGDYATNIALMLAKQAKTSPLELAKIIVNQLEDASFIKKTEIAGPGFINFFLSDASSTSIVSEIIELGEMYGKSEIGKGQSILLEYVSANPTGPLHVGHGRGAAYGATVSNLLRNIGFKVDNEYYVNDAGRQMDILTVSIFLRYLSLCGEQIRFPDNGYQGQYINDIADSIVVESGESFKQSADIVFENICKDGIEGGDKESHIDELIVRAKDLLGDNFQTIFQVGIESILGGIKDDLADFGVRFEKWFSEQSLIDSGLSESCITRLKDSGHIYKKDGALWFKTTNYGDEKDRVVVRDNGNHTYFASDIAYHLEKLERGYDKIINVWGADHHGYIPRVKASIGALGHKPDKLEILLVQFANLYRGGQKVQMSTRSGSFVTLEDLRKEVGNDAARFFYILRKSEQHMDFDLDLAKSKTNENPVFYIQYAHARICSVFRQANEKGFESNLEDANLSLLTEEVEKNILRELSRYKSVIESAAIQYEPHQLAYYLRDLATQFHSYYNACTFILEDQDLTQARLSLIHAAKQILRNGLSILGVGAPESM
ncbi:arginine--tRNA ligase [Candidatus Pseudothioglobus singularis]|jgi:arginyl-tRNA synthetase|uniref:Arginine--tRNA ligase n=1 Tax=Candidatus Pseudothioglobus singularis PS1 TaxID=1125411 RepID=A0A0M4LEG2_9GAMM|nr:arginine--tRNA ligase [Candidatus Pseudothioglobus singularis]MDG1167511.1 arginine--tRNA ligase [Candidatus Thioglobus sp.]ALE02457.1 arginyl-tRNA synthetase [Candidatus Pseudothioglobus singularis PS1]ANQ67119.1 arginine--tRNA ligase [Candidatus Pseudothioglobus singularis]MDA9801885.1 arginine--tRNA ligase [Candidatus Pseudothioglobus singularis]MDB4847281.1 arginine--tRNA ligase [Candidatus Pseudothioglobus singularis]|tara:strand:+ start:3357 stop:5105 length:1749 start_codon:yes stop_codon:yes gene_type:complete